MPPGPPANMLLPTTSKAIREVGQVGASCARPVRGRAKYHIRRKWASAARPYGMVSPIRFPSFVGRDALGAAERYGEKTLIEAVSVSLRRPGRRVIPIQTGYPRHFVGPGLCVRLKSEEGRRGGAEAAPYKAVTRSDCVISVGRAALWYVLRRTAFPAPLLLN